MDCGGTRKGLDLAGCERFEGSGQPGDPPAPALLEEPRTPRGRLQPHRPRVAGVRASPHQARGLEPGNDLRHRRRLHLLNPGQVREADRPPEHEHRERGQPRRPDAGRFVFLPHAPQQVDGRGVQGVGHLAKAQVDSGGRVGDHGHPHPCVMKRAAFCYRKSASVMIEKFACAGGRLPSEFLDLNHTSKSMILVSLMIPKFAHESSIQRRRTSESGH